jgi:hypothetical protein
MKVISFLAKRTCQKGEGIPTVEFVSGLQQAAVTATATAKSPQTEPFLEKMMVTVVIQLVSTTLLWRMYPGGRLSPLPRLGPLGCFVKPEVSLGQPCSPSDDPCHDETSFVGLVAWYYL